MQFLYPSMFWWLLAAFIPVIVHLFNFRRHKLLYFSNVALLRNLQQQSSRKRKLKHILILISRILFIIALVTAFTQPYKLSDTHINPDADNLVGIYLDNSYSMLLPGKEMSLLDESRQKAMQIVKQFGRNNRFYLFTNDFHPAHQRPLSYTEILQEIEQIGGGAPPALLSDVLLRANTLQHEQPAENRLIFVLSDLQKSALDLEHIVVDSSLNLFVVPAFPENVSNIYIDSCWFDSPVLHAGLPLNLIARIGNSGDTEVRAVPVQLEVDGLPTAVTNVDIAPDNTVEISMQFVLSQPGFHQAKLNIIDYPVVFDDELFFSFELRDQIRVLEIFEQSPNRWLALLFSEDEHIRYNSYSRLQLDIQSIDTYDFIILSSSEAFPSGLLLALEKFVFQGGSILIIPPEEDASGLKPLASTFGLVYEPKADTGKTRVLHIEQQHPLLQDVFVKIPDNPDYPTVTKHYALHGMIGFSNRPVITLLNGDPMLLAGSHGRGKTYALAQPLDTRSGDFPANSLFVPVMYRMALMSVTATQLYSLYGEETPIPAPSDQTEHLSTLRIRGIENEVELIPAVKTVSISDEFYVPSQQLPPGHYGLFKQNEMISMVAVNANRSESILDYHQPATVENSLKDKFISLTMVDQGMAETDGEFATWIGATRLYQYFVWMALLFLLIEIFIIRFWK